MVLYIRGELAVVQEQKAIVEAGGIVYGIYMSQSIIHASGSWGRSENSYISQRA